MGEVNTVSFTSEDSGPDAPEPEALPVEEQSSVPDKFRDAETGEINVEALAASYSELEQKLGNPGNEDEPEPEVQETEETEEVAEPEPLPQEALAKFSEEFFETGELKDDSYESLETLGYPKDLVDSFIAGQKALVSNEQDRIYSEVGGPKAYARMSEWASNNMTDEAKVAYNSAVQSGDMEQAVLAVRGLRDSYIRAEGNQPNLLQGKSSANPASAAFRSTAELVKAMSDPRYKEDEAYRTDVESRLRSAQLGG